MAWTLNKPKRPIRTALNLFAGLAALFVIATPFVPLPPIAFVASGFAYSAFLAWVGVGIALAPPTHLRWLMLLAHAVPIFLSLAVGVFLACWPAQFLNITSWLFSFMLGVVSLLILWLVIAAFRGWLQWYRRQPEQTNEGWSS